MVSASASASSNAGPASATPPAASGDPDTTLILGTSAFKVRAVQSDVGRIIDIELIPSGPGDPVLREGSGMPNGYADVVLSATVAEKLAVGIGDELEGMVTRRRQDREESVRLSMNVVGIAPLRAFERDGLFVSTASMAAVEDFLDGRAVPSLNWEGTTPRSAARSFASFRLYARTLGDVAGLRTDLMQRNIEVRTSLADIDLVQTLDRNLSIVYWIIALTVIVGYCLSFATSVWANVDRSAASSAFCA